MNKNFNKVVDTRLSGMTMRPEMKANILSKIAEEGETVVKKKFSLAIALAMVLMVTALAAAMALTNGFGLFEMMGKDKEEEFSTVQPDAYAILKTDVASYSFEHVDVTIKEAVYDGKYLRVVYSTRDRNATAPFSVDLNRTTQAEGIIFDAAEADHINWCMLDWCTVDGQVAFPLGETGTYVGAGNGEIIVWEQFDLRGLTLGDTFTVELPIGNKIETPKELNFTMSSTNLQGVYHIKPPEAIRINDYTAKVSEFLISPIRIYVDLEITVDAGVPIERCNEILGQWMVNGALSDKTGEVQLIQSTGSGGYTENTAWSDKDFLHHVVDETKPVKIIVYLEFLTSSSYPDTFSLSAGDDIVLVPNALSK